MNVYGSFTENVKLFFFWPFLQMTQDTWSEKTTLLSTRVTQSRRECYVLRRKTLVPCILPLLIGQHLTALPLKCREKHCWRAPFTSSLIGVCLTVNNLLCRPDIWSVAYGRKGNWNFVLLFEQKGVEVRGICANSKEIFKSWRTKP